MSSTRPSQAERAAAFQRLHQGPQAFVIANPWDVGSAVALAKLGYQALATSSSASAQSRGRKDGQMGRDDALAHAREVIEAVDVPVSADLENGFGDAPADAAITVTRACEVGLVGCSIEDANVFAPQPIYDFNHAVERVAAAAQAARALPLPFVLTARAENFLRGRPDLEDTIARLQAFERAGADVLFAPGLPTLDAVRQVCAALTKPFNFMVGIPGKSFSVADLQAAGVRRISLSTSLYRVAMAAMRGAATEVLQQGSFGYLDRC